MSNRSFPFFPGQGGPGGGQGFGPPGGGPPGGPPGGGGMAPTSAPPSFTPSQSQGYSMQGGGLGQVGVYAVDPGAIRPCLYQYVYIWPTWGLVSGLGLRLLDVDQLQDIAGLVTAGFTSGWIHAESARFIAIKNNRPRAVIFIS